jgi:hypothetical protein
MITKTATQQRSLTMSPIIERLAQYLTMQNWHFEALNGELLAMSVTARHCKFSCMVQSLQRLNQEVGVFYSVMPQFVPEEHRVDIAEFLTRANHGLVVGNFEMDFESGEVRYKTTITSAPQDLSDGLLEALLHTNISTHDRYVPGMMQVIYAGLSPRAACKQVEVVDLH